MKSIKEIRKIQFRNGYRSGIGVRTMHVENKT